MVFKRIIRRKNTEDKVGKIQIRIIFDPSDKHCKGNIVRSFTVGEGKVSEVAEAIEQILFGEDNQ